MFVYQNANRDICVTFKNNKPVANPEYMISIDDATGTVKINGRVVEAASKEAAKPAATEKATKAATKPTVKVVPPTPVAEEAVEKPKAEKE